MPQIDYTVYVGRPELIGLDADEIEFADLNEALFEDAAAATAITILGGYYSATALVALCSRVPPRPASRRRECRVRIAVGLEASVLLPRVWSEMRQVEQQLRAVGFRNVHVAIVRRDPVHFHTKLFGFLRTTRPIWYIGSANPGSDRHELMVRVSGRHDALSAYADAVFEKALRVSGASRPAPEVVTLRDFFLTGMLCHKPPAQHLFTFDAFRFTPEHRETLALTLVQGVGVEHASPRTEGFGFSLISALGLNEALYKHASGEQAARRIQYRPSCADTVLGMWMPRTYAEELRRRISRKERAREVSLRAVAEVLQSEAGQARARQAFHAHVESMTRFLSEHHIDASPIHNRDGAFQRFLAARTRTLSNPDARARHACILTLADMPDIWEDRRAAEEFEISFFEDIAYRLSLIAGYRGRIVRSIAQSLVGYSQPVTGEELRDIFVERLRTVPWELNEWVS